MEIKHLIEYLRWQASQGDKTAEELDAWLECRDVSDRWRTGSAEASWAAQACSDGVDPLREKVCDG